MTDSRVKNLYWLAGVLLALRFLIVPWIEWQGDRHDALVVLTKRLDRSVGVVENKTAIEKTAQALAGSIVGFHSKFQESESIEAFKLSTQQEITAFISQAGLRVTLFDWMIDKFDDTPPLARARARIQLAGPIASLALVHGRLESRFPTLTVRELRVDPQNPTSTPGTTFGTMTLVTDVYFRQKVASAP